MLPDAQAPGTLDFATEWLERSSGDPVERMTAASVTIRVGSVIATEVEDVIARTVRDQVRVSANLLASWFAENWWRLRWEPRDDTHDWRMAHCMAAIGHGFVWPNLTFESDGEAIQVVGRPTARFGTVRYLNPMDERVPAKTFEDAVDRLLETVTSRLRAVGCADAPLVSLWQEISEERRDPSATLYRRLEAMAGYDPDEAPEKLVDDLVVLAGRYGAGGVAEIAAAEKQSALVNTRRMLARLDSASDEISLPPMARTPGGGRTVAGLGTPPWRRGYDLAGRLRKAIGADVQPVDDRRLSDWFGVTTETIMPERAGPGDTFGSALRTGEARTMRVVLSKRHPNARRFELMRLVGDALAPGSRGDGLLPATSARTARQQLQRAFAAELLCPIEGVMERLGGREPDQDDFASIADDYGVSEYVVVDQWRNRGLGSDHADGWSW